MTPCFDSKQQLYNAYGWICAFGVVLQHKKLISILIGYNLKDLVYVDNFFSINPFYWEQSSFKKIYIHTEKLLKTWHIIDWTNVLLLFGWHEDLKCWKNLISTSLLNQYNPWLRSIWNYNFKIVVLECAIWKSGL